MNWRIDIDINLANRFAIAAGNYIQQMSLLGYYSKKDKDKIWFYSCIGHDAPQSFTWMTQVLSGREIHAWGEETTEGIIKQMEESTRRMVTEVERLRELKDESTNN